MTTPRHPDQLATGSTQAKPTRPSPPAHGLATMSLLVVATVFVACQAATGGATANAKPPGASHPAGAAFLRETEPIVLQGKQLLGLKGIAPDDLVAFRHEGRWRQIPVQVDQRAVVDYVNIYNVRLGGRLSFRNLVYTDANTFTGADPDQTLDANDEVVFMAKDAGRRPGQWSDPPGVVAGSGVQVKLTDPLDSKAGSYVYLFRRSGALKASAGSNYVDYAFKLQAGPYRTAYNTSRGPNREDSTVTTAFYKRHFSDRWISDALSILPPAGTGVDLLDMHKVLFRPGSAIRTVSTFAAGAGAFVANVSGPVRAIRSFVGANSGPFTQRRHVFYERREEVHTFLRVHPIPGLLDFADYSGQAKGMKYFNNLNPSGVKVDGLADRVKTGRLKWELLRGPQGALTILHFLDTNIRNLRPGSYYLDAAKPRIYQCTGDTHAFGASGMWIRQRVGNTSPLLRGAARLTSRRIMLFGDKAASVQTARQHLAQAAAPLRTTISPAGQPKP